MTIKTISHNSLRRGTKVDRHPHAHELHYYYIGNGVFNNGPDRIQINGPVLLYTPPGLGHSVKVTAGCRILRFYTAIFTWPRAPRGLFTELEQRFRTGHTLPAGTYQLLFKETKQQFESGNPYLVRAAEHRLSALVLELCGTENMVPQHETGNRHVNLAIGIMRNMAYTPLNVRELAARLHLNESYFIRLFRRHTGTTPVRYHNDLKVEAAEWRLIHTNDRMRTIAESLGFYDEFHFSRVFKERKGMPPRQYRTALRNA